MKPELDGRGGGYGRFAGKTIGEIREIFDRCETDPSMRSVSIVLRVAREQLDARGNLGHYPTFAGIMGGAVLLTFAIKGLLTPDMQSSLPKLQISLGFVTLCLLVGVYITRNDRRAGIAQEKAIIEMAKESLEKIISSEAFVAKPLDFTQNLTLKKLLGGVKDSPLAALLTP